MYKYVFGPVPSRRLGISLGIDLVEAKTCNFNCIYCECGPTKRFETTREERINIEEVVMEIKKSLETLTPDYLTFSGSGEPTLNKELGRVIDMVRTFYKGKIAVITNSSLLSIKEVREELEKADLIIPSLDSAREEGYLKIDRPSRELKFSNYINGLATFLNETKKEIFLEIFILEGYNDSQWELDGFISFLKGKKIRRIQLNTLAREGSVKGLKATPLKRLNEIKDYFIKNGVKNVEVIKKYRSKEEITNYSKDVEGLIISMVKRRPYTLEEIVELLKKDRLELFEYFNFLEKKEKICIEIKSDKIMIRAKEKK